MDLELSETHPQETTGKERPRWQVWLPWVGLAAVLFTFAGILGVMGGYRSAQVTAQRIQATQAADALVEQYALGMVNLQAGEFDLARQRFEYVLTRDPAFPGAAEGLAEAMRVLYATATPTPLPPTPTPTPTRDLRPVQDLLSQAESLFSAGDWNAVIDTLVTLRQEDSAYRVVAVDRLLYLTLRNRGIAKINSESNLEGGIYDLSLAERFAPLDSRARSFRELARLYMIGSGFWEVYPQQAVYYFGQVAAAAPYLRDASGWTARERYRAVLIQYGDQLARQGEWCAAQEQYDLALSIYGSEVVAATQTYLAYQCSPPTETPSPTVATATPTLTGTPTVSPTMVIGVTLTPSPTSSAATATPTVGMPTTSAPPTLTPTNTAPAPTKTPTPPPAVTETPQPSPTATTPPTTPPPPTPTATITPSPTSESPAAIDTPTLTMTPTISGEATLSPDVTGTPLSAETQSPESGGTQTPTAEQGGLRVRP